MASHPGEAQWSPRHLRSPIPGADMAKLRPWRPHGFLGHLRGRHSLPATPSPGETGSHHVQAQGVYSRRHRVTAALGSSRWLIRSRAPNPCGAQDTGIAEPSGRTQRSASHCAPCWNAVLVLLISPKCLRMVLA